MGPRGSPRLSRIRQDVRTLVRVTTLPSWTIAEVDHDMPLLSFTAAVLLLLSDRKSTTTRHNNRQQQ
jgi:hypothetical protein